MEAKESGAKARAREVHTGQAAVRIRRLLASRWPRLQGHTARRFASAITTRTKDALEESVAAYMCVGFRGVFQKHQMFEHEKYSKGE